MELWGKLNQEARRLLLIAVKQAVLEQNNEVDKGDLEVLQKSVLRGKRKSRQRGIAMAEEKWEVSGFLFSSDAEYEKAKKEAESIAYIKERTNWKDQQQLLKIYNKAAENKMFQTVVGYEFMRQLRSVVIKSGIVEEKYVKTIPVIQQSSNVNLPEDAEEIAKLAEQYRNLYDLSKEEKKRLKIVIGFLVLLVCSMMALAYTNYRTYDETAVLDKYSKWETELEEREARIKAKEKSLGIEENYGAAEDETKKIENEIGKEENSEP